MECKTIVLDIDFLPKVIKTYCDCNNEVVLKHIDMGRYEGVCSACKQVYKAVKRKSNIKND